MTTPTTNPVPSNDVNDLLFNAEKLDEVVSGTGQYYTDRKGVNRRTIAGIDAAADSVLGGLGYLPPVAYASGISLTLSTQTVEYSGEVYAPKVSALPFTTSTWATDSAKLRLIQGVTAADLAMPAAASGIGYAPAGVNAPDSTVEDTLRLQHINAGAYGFSSSASKAENNAAIANAVADLADGGWLVLPPGEFNSDLIVNKGINIIGSGKPRLNGSALVGGTVIKGKVTAYTKGVHLGWFGVDQTSVLDADGIVGGSATDTDVMDYVFHDLALLGRGNASGSLHGIVIQGGEKANISRCDVYRYYHGIALRMSYALAEDCYIEDCDATAIIIKSGGTFPANQCKHTFALNCIARARTSGKKSDFYIESSASGYQTSNVGFRNCTSIGSNGLPFYSNNTAGTGGTDLRNIEFTDCKVFGASGSRGFKLEAGDNIKVRGCHVEDGPEYSYGGDGATNVRVLDCTSRSPTAGHYIGAFTEIQVNGLWSVQAGTAQDGGAISIPAGNLKTMPQQYQIEATTTGLFWTNASGTRKTIVMS